MNARKIHPVDTPPWMDVAWHEYLTWQENDWTINNPDGCRRAQGYIDITGEYFTPHAAGWCGCFVDWVLKKTNQLYGTAFSTVIQNPSGSQNYAFKKQYPGGRSVAPRLGNVPYGTMAVLHTEGWQGHIGFLVDYKVAERDRYAYLLAGNQNGKVCVQEFLVYCKDRKIFYQTRKGKVFTLKGYFFPQEYDLEVQGGKAFEYCTEGYSVEEAIEKHH